MRYLLPCCVVVLLGVLSCGDGQPAVPGPPGVPGDSQAAAAPTPPDAVPAPAPPGTPPPPPVQPTAPNGSLALPEPDPRPLNAVKVGLSLAGEYCGGFVAGDGLVITAGHCFDPTRHGAVTPTWIEFADGTRRPVAKWQRFMPGGAVNAHQDVAWLAFAGKLPAGVRLIPVAPRASDVWQANAALLFRGYTTGPLTLRAVSNMSQTQAAYRQDLARNMGVDLSLDAVRLLYTFTQGQRLHSGDSGGPLYALWQNHWVCIGILSGPYSDDPGDDRSIFTAPGAYIDWIQQTSGQVVVVPGV